MSTVEVLSKICEKKKEEDGCYVFEKKVEITLKVLEDTTKGSADALVAATEGLSRTYSNLLVLPGDAVFLRPHVLLEFARQHRFSNSQATGTTTNTVATACTMLLVDVGQKDPQTSMPLKESKKAKLGFLSREEEDCLCRENTNR